MDQHHQDSNENLDEVQVENQVENIDPTTEQEVEVDVSEVEQPETEVEATVEAEVEATAEIEATDEITEESTAEEIEEPKEVEEEEGEDADPELIAHLGQHIEALIFACDQPITFTEIKTVLEATFDHHFKKTLISGTLKEMVNKYQEDSHAIELRKIGGGYQFLSKPAYHSTIGTYLKQTTKRRLSRAALETLSIVAYKQPATKSEIEDIRGVNCDYAMEKLLEKDLVEILGRRHGPGRPLEYGTSQKFMDYFGLKDLADMPKLKEFSPNDNTVGEAAPIEVELPIEGGQSEPNSSGSEAIQYAIAISSILG